MSTGMRWFTFFLLLIFSFQLKAQTCSTPISAFPYTEGFESSDGNWFTGGTSSDWVWGTPSKPVISAAGGGNKCWITGGLTNSSYNNSENSWLQSPCFNFSGLVFPQISFKIFWETEKKYDGASFQYSIDAGVTWNIVGSINSNGNCQGQNWYNTPSINFLGNTNGWSGNIQSTNGSCQGGGGSNGWLLAKHTLTALAGQPNVMFRFLFGAGTTCNAFDGFAIDDVTIGEAPPNTAGFDYTCKPALTVDFNSQALCPVTTTWDFGDAGSGANNISTAISPTHIFSAAGTYTVKLSSTFISGPPTSSTKQVTVLYATAGVDKPIGCNGSSTATIRAIASGSANITYTWNTNPIQTTAIITNQPAGSYTVNVNAPNACPAMVTIVVSEPAILNLTTSITPAKCTAANGSIVSNVSGGTTPYSYQWSNGAKTKDLNNLAAGMYSLQVTDANGCKIMSNNVMVNAVTQPVPVTLGGNQSICPGQKLVLNPGNFSSYLWQDNTTALIYTVISTGTYSVKVTDASGCTGSASAFINVDCSDIYFPTAFTPNGDSRNDGFGALGNLFAVKNYTLSVYNRYGQLVFLTHDPYQKWPATFKGAPANTETYTWFSSYNNNGKPYNRKGTVTVIR